MVLTGGELQDLDTVVSAELGRLHEANKRGGCSVCVWLLCLLLSSALLCVASLCCSLLITSVVCVWCVLCSRARAPHTLFPRAYCH